MHADLDAILGTTPKAKVAPARKPANGHQEFSTRTSDVHGVAAGVSVAWLSTAFRMSRVKIEKALAECTPIRTTQNGGLIYDLKEAAAYLVEPRIDLRAYLKTLQPHQLPEHLRDGVWAARLKEQRWRENAGDLWRSEDVLEVLRATFKTVKDQTMLWTDLVDSSAGLTPKQRKALQDLTDRLLNDIHEKLVKSAKRKRTPSQLAELEEG